MSDYPIEYQKGKEKDFWCEQDAKWHPKCECKIQCFECGLVQGNDTPPEAQSLFCVCKVPKMEMGYTGLGCEKCNKDIG